MALPTMTPEQREAGLAKAAETRRVRSELKEQLKERRTTLGDVLARADGGDTAVAKMRLSELLRALPGVGRVKVEGFMTEHEIPAERRVSGLGSRQREAVLATFGG